MAQKVIYLDMVPGDRVSEMILAGIRRYCWTRGWEVDALPESDSIAAALPGLFRERRPLGCVVFEPMDCAPLPPRIFGAVPSVFVGTTSLRERKSGHAARLAFDEEAVARTAFRELSAGRPDAYATVIFRAPRFWSLRRERAFHALAVASGKPCLRFRKRMRPREESVAERALRFAAWVAGLPRHTAVFAVNDDTAAEVVAACRAAGLRIPNDIAVLGVDNDESICEAVRPALSSIQMDFEAAGFQAARILAENISHRDTPKCFTVGPLLAVRRESTRGRGRREPYILAAMDMIRREALDGLTAAALAARFPGSRRLFELRFREAMGHSVLDEIQSVRLEKVYTLLARTDTAIGAIPGLCGYRSDIALRKLFFRREGMSMQAWRRKNGQ